MKKLLLALILITTPLYAEEGVEVIAGFEKESDLPVLNNELRKLDEKSQDIDTSVTAVTARVTALEGDVDSTLTAGTSCVQNPWTASAKTTTAHGLGATPTMVVAYLENISAELGYAVGDRINLIVAQTAADSGSIISWDATNVDIISHSVRPYVVNKTTPASMVQITAANWKVVVVPYKLV